MSATSPVDSRPFSVYQLPVDAFKRRFPKEIVQTTDEVVDPSIAPPLIVILQKCFGDRVCGVYGCLFFPTVGQREIRATLRSVLLSQVPTVYRANKHVYMVGGQKPSDPSSLKTFYVAFFGVGKAVELARKVEAVLNVLREEGHYRIPRTHKWLYTDREGMNMQVKVPEIGREVYFCRY